MKLSFSQKYRPDPELLALKEDLREAQWELTLAYRRFNQAVDPELVESCVYHISAAKARCNYLIRTIKALDPEALTAASRVPTEAQQHGFGGKTTSSEGTEPSPQGEGKGYGACEEDAVWT